MTARQLRRGPGAPGGWSRFLLAHLRWILITTLVVVGAAAAYAHHRTPEYASQANVDVWFASADPNALQGPNMVTEKGIVSSGAVLAIASHDLGVPQSVLLNGLSLSVPAGSSIMQVGYSDPVPWTARERAQVIAEAYVKYRSPRATSARHGTKTAPGTAPRTTPTQLGNVLRATVITAASLPTSPSSPNYLIDILAALVVGLGLAIGTAALRDHLDDRIRGPVDLEAQTGAPVLALVPAFRAVSRDPGSELVLTWSPDSLVAEAYRNLRTQVVMAAAPREARILLVTSPAWEMRSTVAANLSAALAQTGRRTVLVCADLRWGWAHELFGADNSEGLTMALDHRIGLAAALRPTGVRNLLLLPPGPLPADPAELLQRPALRTLLGELRSRADFVVMDAPPLLASPDAVALAQLADMALLVCDARKTTRAQTQAALHEAGESAGQLVGCVLCNVGRRRWLRRSPAPAVRTDQSDRDPRHWPGTADAHEEPPAMRPANSISSISDPA